MIWPCIAIFATYLTCPASARRVTDKVGEQVFAHEGKETLSSSAHFQDQEDLIFGISANHSYPVPYVDYITGCSKNSDCFFDVRRGGCHCDNWGCLDKGTRHPSPWDKSIFEGANQFCSKNPSFFSTDLCLCNQKYVIRHEVNVKYRQQILEEKQAKDNLSPAQLLKDLEAKVQARWQSLKEAGQTGKNSVRPQFSQLSSQDRIVSLFHVCTEMEHIPVVDASHCGVIFQTTSDTYYAEFAAGSLGSTKTGLPGSVRAFRAGDGASLDSDGLATVMWRNGYAPMKKSMQYFHLFHSDRSLSGRNISPFEVAKWMNDYQLQYPYYSLTFRNCQHFSGTLYSKIRGVEFNGKRDLIDYAKLVALSVGHGIVPGLTDMLQGMGSF
jgi:hypothetical protein